MPWKECSVMDERLQFVARGMLAEDGTPSLQNDSTIALRARFGGTRQP
jgi:hypothetical protein